MPRIHGLLKEVKEYKSVHTNAKISLIRLHMSGIHEKRKIFQEKRKTIHKKIVKFTARNLM